VMNLLKGVASGKGQYGFVPMDYQNKAKIAVDLGIDCILKTQIREAGELKVWCAQHDEKTLAPAWARAYEPPSLSGSESVGILRFLMSIDNPSPKMIAAIEGGINWFKSVAITDYRLAEKLNPDGRTERLLLAHPNAPLLWARFYELGTNRPLYVDRDSKFRYSYNEISYERRSGYRYLGDWAKELIEVEYPVWKANYVTRKEQNKPPILTSTDVGGTEEIPLYKGNIPNNKNELNTERIEYRKKGGRAIHNVAIPTLTIFKPKFPNGKAVIICPGGGYARLAFDKEGVLVAQALNRDSITAFVLKYRIPQDDINMDKSIAPLQDAQQAIRYVRKQASFFDVNPNQIGIMGFSAGGHLAASAATHFTTLADITESDTTSVRPDFTILIYPVISFTDTLTHLGSRRNLIGDNPTLSSITHWSLEQQVSATTPPTFLIHAGNDKGVPVGNSLAFYQACLDKNVSAEMHLYPKGGHGFGMYNPTTNDDWMQRLINWMQRL
ncbi:MAG: pectate lyase, partial [Saprospiraceae bacterium]